MKHSRDKSSDRDMTDQSLDTSKSNIKLQNTNNQLDIHYQETKKYEETMKRAEAKARNGKSSHEVPPYFNLCDDEEEEDEVDFESELKKTSHAIRKAEFDI